MRDVARERSVLDGDRERSVWDGNREQSARDGDREQSVLDGNRERSVGLGGADDRKEALESDQKLDEFLFVRKRPLLVMQEKDRSCPALSRFKSDGPGK